jgi:dipicolinate synthase subunit A
MPRQKIDGYRVIFNTVPAPVIDEAECELCRSDCLKIDLASELGIAGEDVLWARGLPGKDAPESSGRLIALTAARLLGQR